MNQSSSAMNPSILNTLLVLSFFLIIYFFLHDLPPCLPQVRLAVQNEAAPHSVPAVAPLPASSHHILFAIASSAGAIRRRAPYLRLWSTSARAILFLDSLPPADPPIPSLPPMTISEDTSRFPFTFRRGLPSAVRLARIVKEAVDRNDSDIRWFVFGDDDTVFFVDNLIRTLSKYDHDQWFYIGGRSESYVQNEVNSFDMAFGGGGFALSHSLARVLAGVLDSCLLRYPHLFGSDARIFSCLAELGVGLTHEPGFHQVKFRVPSFSV